MARRRKLDLSDLYSEPPEDLRLASLAYDRLEGLTHRYTLILPLFSERTGEEIFSLADDVPVIIKLLNERLGGCTTLAFSRGTWLEQEKEYVEGDRIMHLYVYARQQDDGPVLEFFQRLKERLRRFGKQTELTLERADVRLLAGTRRRA